jgi:serine/threonine-protein kinase
LFCDLDRCTEGSALAKLLDKPRAWSEKRVLDLGVSYSYDLAPDGKRFAAVLYADGSSEQRPVTNLAFLLNFFDELRRRVPAENK